MSAVPMSAVPMPAAPVSAAPAPPLTALSLIDAHGARDAAHPAILFEDQVLSYGELVSQSRRLARLLHAYGLRAGDRVCLIARNSPLYYIAYFAALRCGAAFFPINSDLTRDDIEYIVERSDPRLVIADVGMLPLLQAICAAHEAPRTVLGLEALLEESAREQSDTGSDRFPTRSPADVALVIHTSGTTARPKGVVATDEMEIASAQALHRCWDIGPKDISICALPLSYTFGLFSASYVALCAGATVLLFPKFNPVRVLEGIEKHRPTYMVGVPTMYSMMLEHVQQTGRRYDLSSMRMMAASGAPITPQTKQDFERNFGVVLRDYYALSECTPIFSFDLRKDVQLPPLGSAGRLVDGAEVELLDDQGHSVAVGETGALHVRSGRLTPGYYEDPERNAVAFREGWFKTGDLAYRDAQGYYFIVGRDRDQVISGGHKIASTEVENLIARLSPVAHVAVVGAPHPILGEVVKAVIVCKDGESLETDEVMAFCTAHLAPYKVPKLVEFREVLPVSPAGKVLKRELI